jgi:glycosyltransferase involved in cell wall biosynthesis
MKRLFLSLMAFLPLQFSFAQADLKLLEKIKSKRIIFLHNFRPWCSNGFMLRRGTSCRKCLSQKIWGTLYRCSSGSFSRSFVQSLGQRFNHYLPRLERSGAMIVAVSKATQEQIADFGGLSDVRTLSNFAFSDPPTGVKNSIEKNPAQERFIWAGRMTKEKGLSELLSFWPSEYILDIYGSGADGARLSQVYSNSKNITFKGTISNQKLREILPTYSGFVNSSTWSEFGPMTIIEALAAGIPIVFPIKLPLAKLISGYRAGVSYEFSDPNSLHQALASVLNPMNVDQYRTAATKLFRDEFSVESWHEKLINLYAIIK